MIVERGKIQNIKQNNIINRNNDNKTVKYNFILNNFPVNKEKMRNKTLNINIKDSNKELAKPVKIKEINDKSKNKNIKKEEKENKGVKNDNINNNNNSENINNFDIEFEKFKEEITKTSIYIYEINGKIKPCLSENFLKSISII